MNMLANIQMDSTGAGAGSGGKIELSGTLDGNNFNLILDSGSHVSTRP